jgi:hypothetical protein
MKLALHQVPSILSYQRRVKNRRARSACAINTTNSPLFVGRIFSERFGLRGLRSRTEHCS